MRARVDGDYGIARHGLAQNIEGDIRAPVAASGEGLLQVGSKLNGASRRASAPRRQPKIKRSEPICNSASPGVLRMMHVVAIDFCRKLDGLVGRPRIAPPNSHLNGIVPDGQNTIGRSQVWQDVLVR